MDSQLWKMVNVPFMVNDVLQVIMYQPFYKFSFQFELRQKYLAWRTWCNTKNSWKYPRFTKEHNVLKVWLLLLPLCQLSVHDYIKELYTWKFTTDEERPWGHLDFQCFQELSYNTRPKVKLCLRPQTIWIICHLLSSLLFGNPAM